MQTLPEVKIEVLNSALFMGIVNWFSAGNSVDGLKKHLTDIIRVCTDLTGKKRVGENGKNTVLGTVTGNGLLAAGSVAGGALFLFALGALAAGLKAESHGPERMRF